MKRYILVDRKPVECDDLMTWAIWFAEHDDETLVKRETIGQYFVSTRFLGIERQIFETMAFLDGVRPPHELITERCSTWEDAEANHALVSERVRRMSVN
jgi:hypothetical protein